MDGSDGDLNKLSLDFILINHAWVGLYRKVGEAWYLKLFQYRAEIWLKDKHVINPMYITIYLKYSLRTGNWSYM